MKHDTSDRKARVAVLTVSDSRLVEDDLSGNIAVEELESAGHSIANREIVPDEMDAIAAYVTKWAGDETVDAIVVTGGTGPSKRDVTPEAVLPLLTTTMPGFGELFRQLSYEEIGAAAMLSRANAGWIDVGTLRTPIFLLPGSHNAVKLAMEKFLVRQLGHVVDLCLLESTQ